MKDKQYICYNKNVVYLQHVNVTLALFSVCDEFYTTSQKAIVSKITSITQVMGVVREPATDPPHHNVTALVTLSFL